MKKKRMFYLADCLLISGLMTYTLLDTFLIRQEYQTVDAHVVSSEDSSNESNISQETASVTHSRHSRRHADDTSAGSGTVTAGLTADNSSYSDDNISITLQEYTWCDTQIYVADVQLSSIDYLYTAFADNIYGKNVTAKTSTTAAENGAILAINGDYYGARNTGYVLRNGVLYRDSAASSSQEDLVIHADGSFSIITEGSVSASSLEDDDVLQVFSFGPALITDGEISVTLNEEVGKAMASNPRTAICEIEPLHYLFVVADGRTDASEGLSLYELAQFLQENFTIRTAYNLDGGGSSTMVFNGQLVNHPTTSGSSISERSVSDVICIGY
ncbi:MAG: phosphodiester glycosidase family protein [Solobacterium sp.]|nr:phosphodiester glycosidase family protein [Solobacterium sp.]